MKKTKKLEAEIKQFMDDYWNSYLNGDLEKWASYLPNHYKNIGTTQEEIWNSKKEIVDYTHRVFDQMVGMAQIKNKQTQIIPYDPYIMVHELGDLYIKIDNNWAFYAKLRLSTLLEKTKDSWKVLHQHGSYPDSKTEEGETFAFDKISKENSELREAIRRRTIELEQKNRELEIETALEKVRSSALAMKEPQEMVEVCRIISEQLKSLGVNDVRNVQTAVINEHEGTYLNYQYFTEYDQGIVEETEYNKHPKVFEMVQEMKRSENSTFNGSFEGEELNRFREYRKKDNQLPDPLLDEAESLHYYFYSIGSGGLGLSTYKPLNEAALEIFKRFHNVFTLAYRRFIDIEKAEAQAREARIETALERVRAVAMAMRKPDELSVIGKTLFTELKALDFPQLRNTEIIINNDLNETVLSYYYSDYGVTGIIEIDYKTNPVVQKWASDMRKTNDAFTEVKIVESEIDEWRAYRLSLGYLPDPKLDKASEVFYYSYSIGLGALSVSSFESVSDDQIKILKRFRNVFDLAYRRYNDIALAEKQSRESQIELALERVRARTMAMQSSNELKEVVLNLFDGLKSLGVDPTVCNISLIDEKTCDSDVWSAHQTDNGLITYRVYISHFEHPFRKNLIDSFLNRTSFSVHELSGDTKKSYIQYLIDNVDYSSVPDEVTKSNKKLVNIGEGIVLSAAYMKYGLLIVSRNIAISNDESDILQRFAKIFEQTYTRFLDLKKAESQAREAQIEAALERVRAKAMAMHSSEDISDTMSVLFTELPKLGIGSLRCGVVLLSRESFEGIFYAAATTEESDSQTVIGKGDMSVHPIFMQQREHWTRNENYFITLRDEELRSYYAEIFRRSSTPYNPKEHEMRTEHGYYFSFSEGMFYVWNEEPYPEESINILNRFRAIIDLTFRRYFDLKKAEAQAREAQIEAALEKVRAHTMGMQKSDEIKDVVKTVMDKMNELNIEMNGGVSLATFIEGSQDLLHWYVNPDHVDGPITMHLPYFDNVLFHDFNNARNSGKEILPVVYSFEQKNEYFDYTFRNSDFKIIPEELKTWILEQPYFGYSVAIQKYSAIFFNDYTGKFFSEEENDVLIRFAKVFDQAYIRFLDLQKAEAQAREAQIEAALEKVRSRSLAMHKSEELGEVASVVFEKLRELNFPVNDGIAIVTHIEGSKDQIEWMENPGFPSAIKFYQTYFDHPILSDYWEAKNRGLDFVVRQYTAEENRSFLNHIFEFSDYKHTPQEVKDYCLAAHTYSYSAAFQKHSSIFINDYSGRTLTEHEIEIVKRFSKVFEQAYVRFLDLQKAEVQAREAKIEAALEKVRAHTMGMQSSEDLSNVASVMFDQMKNLGGELFAFGIVLCDKDREMVEQWHNLGNEGMISPFSVPVDLDYIHRYRYDKWKAGEELFSIEIPEDYIARHFELMFELPSVKAAMDEVVAQGIEVEIPDWEIDYGASFKHGYLLVSSRKPFKEDHIFPRFAKVFDQAYTRFLDLQKAEAQAREAQIEAALERVRSRSLAMHKTDELQEVVRVVAEELKNTGVILDTWGAVICTYFQDSKDVLHWTATEDPAHPSVPYLLPYFKDELFDEAWASKNRGDEYFAKEFSYDVKNAFFNYAFEHSDYRQLPDDYKKIILESKSHGLAWAWSKNSAIMIPSIQGDLPSEEEKEILIRFAKVFEQSFIRFLDLQKAEAQARDAQIEAALERLRAKAMAMHHSDELDEVLAVLCEQFDILKIFPMSAHMTVLDIENNKFTFRETGKFGNRSFGEQTVALDAMDTWKDMVESWKNAEPYSINSLHFPKETLPQVWEVFHESFASMPEGSRITPDDYPDGIYHTAGKHPYGYIGINQIRKATEEEEQIVIKFANEFGRAYTRFLDLQKAEAQAREAKIELSLERIRARVTAMRESSELLDIVVTMRTEFVALGHEAHYFWYMRWLPDKYEKAMTSGDGTRIGMVMTLPRHIHGDVKLVADWEKGDEPTLVFAMDTDAAVEYVDKMITLGDFQQVDPQAPTLDDIRHLGGLTFIMARTTHGEIGFSLPGRVPDPSVESVATLARFASVFDLAYKRFEDLKSSERQRREAQIELALERTRTQSMLMQHSSDLNEISKTFHEQLLGLGIDSEFSFVWLPDEVKQKHLFWATWVNEINGVVQYQSKAINYPLDKTEPGTAKCYRDWESEQPVHETYVPPDQIASFFAEWKELLRGAEKLKPELFPEGIYYTEAYMKYGCFGIDIRRQLTAEEKEIVRRFSVEFERTYTRFLDLQKAEAQAREGQIQLALEKVRMVALGLNKSEEMLQVAKALYEQLLELGFSNIRNAIIDISNGDGETFTDYDYSHEMSGTITQMSYYDDPTLAGQFKKMADTTDDFFELILEGKELEDLVNMRLKNGEAQDPRLLNTDLLTYNLFSFGNGAIGVSNFGLLNEEEKSILNRFRNVFTFAYKRYNDLAAAEAQAKEAIKQASLDRIRGEIASMRTSEDLNRITPIIWRELKTLDVPFIRCGVFIIDEADEKVQVYLTTPDGKSLGVLNLSFNENELTRNTVEYWKKREVFREHWNKEEFIKWTNSMIEIGQIQNAETYQGSSAPPESLDLHFVPFTQGMLYVGDVSSLTDEKLNLVKTLAEAFSIAYARYEDFKNLEEAKNKIELTLHELKSAQAQLVHSEKMASLGELTAGIAHEIKNPLNFVNNFSEMSAELINEIEEELEKNDKQEVLEILKDLKQNLDKINQHGKRADSIVKGMLLHSRGTSGEKTPTDINDLLDQYVNLAYHGMRATNKEFNITIEKDYDKSLEKINVVPQDLSRVFLNIINNACYAAYERKKNSNNNFSPTLKVSTKNLKDKVEIRIGDNGNGIPKNIIEKIFQPFFTTKPTGEGTGLGLSLSYDIVTKVHGGELKVETLSAGEAGDGKKGTEFIIQLPIA